MTSGMKPSGAPEASSVVSAGDGVGPDRGKTLELRGAT